MGIVLARCFQTREAPVSPERAVGAVEQSLETLKFQQKARSQNGSTATFRAAHSSKDWLGLLEKGEPPSVTIAVTPHGSSSLVTLQHTMTFQLLIVFYYNLATSLGLFLLASTIPEYTPEQIQQSAPNVIKSIIVFLLLFATLIHLYVGSLISPGYEKFTRKFFDTFDDCSLTTSNIVSNNLEHPETKRFLALSAITCGYYVVRVYDGVLNLSAPTTWTLVLAGIYVSLFIHLSMVKQLAYERLLPVIIGSLICLSLWVQVFGGYYVLTNSAGQVSALLEKGIIASPPTFQDWLPFLFLPTLYLAALMMLLYHGFSNIMELPNHLLWRAKHSVLFFQNRLNAPVSLKVSFFLIWVVSSLLTLSAILFSLGLLYYHTTGSLNAAWSFPFDQFFDSIDTLIAYQLGIEPADVPRIYQTIAACCIALPSLLLSLRLLQWNLHKYRTYSRIRKHTPKDPPVYAKNTEKLFTSLKGTAPILRDVELRIVPSSEFGMGKLVARVELPFLPFSKTFVVLGSDTCQELSQDCLELIILHELGHVANGHARTQSWFEFLTRWTVAGQGMLDPLTRSSLEHETAADVFAVTQFNQRHPSKNGIAVFSTLLELTSTNISSKGASENAMAFSSSMTIDAFANRFERECQAKKLRRLWTAIRILNDLMFHCRNYSYLHFPISERLERVKRMIESK